MRQRLAIIITIAVVLVLLVAINTASYVTEERLPDTEFNPDRSTYNTGATGTRAFYDLLAESGRKVMRWRTQAYSLLDANGTSPSTFVIIGKTRAPFEEDETKTILNWVARGGRLIIIDRRPDARLLPKSVNWSVSTGAQELPRATVNPNKPDEMTAGVARVSASLPSALTRDIDSIQPSRYAGTINISDDSAVPVAVQGKLPPAVLDDDDEYYEDADEQSAPPFTESAGANQTLTSPAPVAHFEDHKGALLVDYPHGSGRVIILSDPYIVANGGIHLADNLQLALNISGSSTGLIAFDEYHQERGGSSNQFVAYFAGTPVLWMLAQGALIILVLLWTRGRRFARPLPVPFVDRRSSLEFVASMAELQQRARAYDLAIENIYTRVRRVLVRYAGLSHNSPRSEIAARVAARSQKLDSAKLESLMHECEEAINGAHVDERKSLELITRLREVERALGLRMRSRENRQAAEGLQQNSLL